MEKQKALLLLTGGRGVPDMLIVKYLRPDVVFNITTMQGMKHAESLRDFVAKHFGCSMRILPAIDPYNEQEIKQRCIEAIHFFPNAEWIMHFTGSPKIVGIYAHDVARAYNIPYLFLDTGGEQVISLVKPLLIEPGTLYRASVEEYIGAYGRTYEIPKPLSYRQKVEAWFSIAKIMARQPEITKLLIQALRQSSVPGKLQVEARAEPLLHDLSTAGAISIDSHANKTINCTLADRDMVEFMKGDWLEVYVWNEVREAGFADDYQWGYKVVAEQPANELDVTLTYKARLLITECKTSRDPFNTEHLYKLHSVADLLGTNYVRQVFVTHYPCPASDTNQYDNFCQQAQIRRIKVVTGDQLPDIGKILREQIGATEAHNHRLRGY